MSRIKFLLFTVIFFTPNLLYAQINEGVLLSTQPLPTDSRGMAMGGNLISAANGIDALDYNPAALAPIASRIFTIGFFNRDHSSDAQFLGSSSNSQFDQMSISSVGVAAPFATVQGHAAIGISFDRVRDYNSAYSFSAINNNSSYFNTQGFLTQGGYFPLSGFGYQGNSEYFGQSNLAYGLGLTYGIPDTGAYSLSTPITKGMLQSGNVTTEGGLNAVRIGGGIDIAKDISIGATVNILFGTYDFIENYSETNVNHIVTDTGANAPAGFQSATITTALHQDQSGGSIKFGLLVDKKIAQFGLTVETPQWMHINENSQQYGSANFGANGYFNSDGMGGLPLFVEQYDIVTPIKFSAGGSVHLAGFTGSASVSYMNMAQLQFTNSTVDMSSENSFASDSLRGVLSYQIGGEYVIPGIGITVRAGYSFEPSPYKGDPTNYGITAISGGLGFALTKYVDLEAAIRLSTYHTFHTLYNDVTPDNTPVSASVNDDAVSRDDISLTLNYRY
jgi:hypothetical protein